MSDAQHERVGFPYDASSAPFPLSSPSPYPQYHPVIQAGMGRGFSARPGDYPAMPERPVIRDVANFSHTLDPVSYGSPFDRDTYCSAHRAAMLNGSREAWLGAQEMAERMAAGLPRWILTDELLPVQVSAVEAARWFTQQLTRSGDNLIALAETDFDNEAAVRTHFTGRTEHLWETTVYVDGDLTIHRSHTLEEANRTHTGCVARLIAHSGMEPTFESRKLKAVAGAAA